MSSQMSELQQITQAGLEEIGIPTEYAQPAAQILASEIERTEQGEMVERSEDEQRIIDDAYFWVVLPTLSGWES